MTVAQDKPGPRFNIKAVFPDIPIVNIVIFIMGIALIIRHIFIEMASRKQKYHNICKLVHKDDSNNGWRSNVMHRID